ncbi:conserved oligomeric Golgi complex subunit 7-like [Oppia nitens]|uniref:conserved oligomeric Golgi complex subunit 7-like n=1 Tax=Oppia nitens TaxID=1686743 RepID=UPI0023DB0F99|nr:conserved oligomeric Golgi complex subunit 7-like [Oppia nitens]
MDKIDLTVFSDDNFDAINWINNWFAAIDDKSSTEIIATNLVFKLQLLVQEVNNSLGENAQQMVNNLPKVLRETEDLQKESILLKEQMAKHKDKLDKMSLDSSKSIEKLMALDVIKTRMTDTCKALEEADNWTTLWTDVEEVLVSGDRAAIASKLVGMQNSLDILIDVQDYEQRVQRLEELKDKFESLIESDVINSFSSQVISDSAHIYIKLFKDMKRLPKLKCYYHKCLKDQILHEWKRIIALDPEENVMDWMNALHDYLLSLWHSQTNFCTQMLFPNDFDTTVETLSDLFVDVFSSLDPNLTHCMIECIEKQVNSLESIHFIIEMKQFTYHFAKSIELSIESNLSVKLLNKPNVQLLAQVLYSPYQHLLDKYIDLEKQSLSKHLQTLEASGQPSETLGKAFTFAKEVEKRCHQLCQSVAIPCLLPILQNYFMQYLAYFKSSASRIRVKSDSIDNSSSIPDFSLFQLSLFTLQASGELVIQTELFQQQLYTTLIDISKKILTNSSNETMSPFNRFDQLILSANTRKQLTQLLDVLIETESSATILESVLEECKNICSMSASIVIDCAMNYIQNHLNEVSKLVTDSFKENVLSCEEEDMHSFSLSPQEYITQIGQYLLTIPQHLEPFVLEDNIAFKVALKYIRLIKDYSFEPTVSDTNAAEYLLDCMTQRTIDSYINTITKLNKITNFAKQQLITDISYLCDVLDDLGLTPSQQFQLLLKILKSSPDEFQQIKQTNNSMFVNAIETLLSK